MRRYHSVTVAALNEVTLIGVRAALAGFTRPSMLDLPFRLAFTLTVFTAATAGTEGTTKQRATMKAILRIGFYLS